ncbi:MAG: DUF559 domain-containing protein [Chlorobi bacterium]|nr:DUF559 domain-containing protein [Chlorobiota bacterium]
MNETNDTPGFQKHKKYLPYNKKLKGYSRNLRNESTLAEIFLWKQLRAAKLGYTFNRQKPLLNYIVDFFCSPLHLVIEADGMSHWDEKQKKKDKIRQRKLEEYGLHFLRFDNDEILHEMDNVIATIVAKIEELEKVYPEALRRRKKPRGEG